jgi:serine/threonine-protein phosphatase 2A regulatory subunit B
LKGENNLQYELNFNKKTIARQIPPKYFENLGSNYDFSRKVLRNTCCSNQNIIAMACLNCLYFYQAP